MGGFNTSVPQPSPLELRPPQSESPLQAIAQMQELKLRNQEMQTHALQQQSAQQQMQTHALEQQRLQMDLDQRKAINEAYQQAFKPQADGSMALDENGLTSALATGGHGGAIPGIMENWTKYRQSLATLQETSQKVQSAEQDAAGNLANTVKAAKNDPHLFHALLTDAINKKILGADHYKPLDQQLKATLDADPTGEQARALVSQITDQMIAGSPKQQELANSRMTAQARQQGAATGEKKETREATQQNFQNAISALAAAPPQSAQEYQYRVQAQPPDVQARILAAVPVEQYNPKTSIDMLRKTAMTPEQQTQATQAAANQATTAAHYKVVEAQGAGRLGVERGNLAINQQRWGFEQGGGVSPQARMAAEGKMAPQTLRMMLRSNPGLMKQIQQVDPSFDEASLDTRYQNLQDFSSTSNSKAGGQLLALNTLIHHADLYLQTAEALKNGTFRPGNKLYNQIADMFGSAPPTQANLVAQFLAGETAKVATGGVPGEQEVNRVLQRLGGDAGPEQMAGAAQTLLGIASGRMIPLQERVKQNKLENVVHVVGPDAADILQRRGYDPKTLQPKKADGARGTPAHQVGDTVMYEGKPHKIKGIKPNGKLVLE